MKASILCGAALFSLTTFAFPTSLLNSDISDATLAEITALADKITKEIETRRHPVVAKRGFNADAQLISTTGEHEYVRHPTETKENRLLTIATAEGARTQ
jgi:hypothetical protein